MDTHLLAYIAGVIDCDGSIQVMRTRGPARKLDGVRPDYFMVRVTVTQVDPRIHDLLKEQFGGSIYRYERENGGKGYWYTWTLANVQAAHVLRAVLPYLVLKGKQAEAAIKLSDLISEQTALRKGHGVIPPEWQAQRLALLKEVRQYNARSKATRYRELMVDNPI